MKSKDKDSSKSFYNYRFSDKYKGHWVGLGSKPITKKDFEEKKESSLVKKPKMLYENKKENGKKSGRILSKNEKIEVESMSDELNSEEIE